MNNERSFDNLENGIINSMIEDLSNEQLDKLKKPGSR